MPSRDNGASKECIHLKIVASRLDSYLYNIIIKSRNMIEHQFSVCSCKNVFYIFISLQSNNPISKAKISYTSKTLYIASKHTTKKHQHSIILHKLSPENKGLTVKISLKLYK